MGKAGLECGGMKLILIPGSPASGRSIGSGVRGCSTMAAMFLKQYYLGCLAHASYLLADEESGSAIAVDPQRDVQQYLADAESLGVRIRYVFLTHFHADFLAGHLELRDRCGAEIRLGSNARAEYAFLPMKDGDTLELSGMRLQVMETPGHTIESISILLFDLKANPGKPHAVLTGDTLFIGDVGRPDLRVSLGWTARELGGHLYDSLHSKLLLLPDETLVYPAHGAGSLCGKNMSSATVSTLGEQRRYNYALQPMTREQFTCLVTADQPDAPAYFTYDAILNTRERTTLDVMLRQVLQPLDLDEILALGDAGAQVLDVREAAEYAKGHLAGSVNIGLGGQYATWAGTILDRTRPIVILAEPGREPEAALRLGRIGFDHVKGFLRDGMEALAGRPDLVWSTERVSPSTLAEELASHNPPMVIDIRAPREWHASRLGVSINLPLPHLQERIGELPRDRRIAVHCAGGYRSSIAAGILNQHGITNLIELAGGIAAWEAAMLPLVTDS
jgi:hydroxyacylglutathione hydrolase